MGEMIDATAFVDADGSVVSTGAAGPIPWWSFTKTALAIAVVRLWELGKLDLDGAVQGKSYTYAQLLRHEAGLPDYGSLREYHDDVKAGAIPWPVDVLHSKLSVDQLRYEPGTDWSYSNVGYHEVAQLIQQASDLPLADALSMLVLSPAGLTTTRLALTPTDLEAVEMGCVADYHPGWVYHGLLVGSIIDAASLLYRLLDESVFGPRLLSRMLELRSLPQFRSELHRDPAYGLGLMLTATNPQVHPIGHSGAGPGSQIAVYGQNGQACAVWAPTTSKIVPEAVVFRRLSGAHHEI